MRRKQFTLYLENKPGVLATVTRKLASAKVNLDGISVSESTDVGLVQIVPDNAAATRRVLKAARVPFTSQEVALITLKHRTGELARLASILAQKGVNINYIYATGCSGGGACASYAIVSAPELGKVEKAWAGMK